MNRLRLLEMIWQDALYALRAMRQNPVDGLFTAHHRHGEIEQHDGDFRVVSGYANRFQPVVRHEHLMAANFKRSLRHAAHHLLVVHHQHRVRS